MESRDCHEKEVWVKWDSSIPEGDYFSVSKLIKDENGTTIYIDDKKISVEIRFDDFSTIPTMIRSVYDEYCRMWTWGIIQKHQNKDSLGKCFLFKVENSGLKEWLKSESCTSRHDVIDAAIHYCIVTCEDFIDVISASEPIVTFKEISSEKEEPPAQNSIWHRRKK